MLQSALQNVLTALEELEMGFLKIGLFHGWKRGESEFFHHR